VGRRRSIRQGLPVAWRRPRTSGTGQGVGGIAAGRWPLQPVSCSLTSETVAAFARTRAGRIGNLRVVFWIGLNPTYPPLYPPPPPSLLDLDLFHQKHYTAFFRHG
jgi:hypothetical protein